MIVYSASGYGELIDEADAEIHVAKHAATLKVVRDWAKDQLKDTFGNSYVEISKFKVTVSAAMVINCLNQERYARGRTHIEVWVAENCIERSLARPCEACGNNSDCTQPKISREKGGTDDV